MYLPLSFIGCTCHVYLPAFFIANIQEREEKENEVLANQKRNMEALKRMMQERELEGWELDLELNDSD